MNEIVLMGSVVVAICSLAWIGMVQADTQLKMARIPRNLRRPSTFTETTDR